MSFAITGVLILIMGSFSTLYIVSMNSDYVLQRIEDTNLERMKNCANLVHQEVETQAYFSATTAVYTATQVLHDQEQIMPLFNESFNKYIENNFPKNENNFVIEVTDYTTGIFFDTMNMYDIIPTNEEEDIDLKGKGKKVESKTISNERAGEYGETSSIVYYILNGDMNYTISDTKSSDYLKKSFHMERKIESAFPFLESKLDILDAGTKGMSSPIPRTVKYILTTISQYKVLQGYGMGELTSATLDLPNKETSQILTKDEVELALNVALLLETARLYRSYDHEVLLAIDDNFQNLDDSDFDKSGSMEELIRTYVWNGTIDAADIIALYLGIEEKTINIKAIIAQALNALIDQFILKYLDYFHLMDILDIVFYGVQAIKNAIEAAGKAVDDFIGWITGESTDERNLRRIKDWVSETVKEDAGLRNTYVMHDIETHVDSAAYYITLTKSGYCGHWEDTDSNSSTPDEWVVYTWSTEVTYEVEIQPGDYTVDFYRYDILRGGLSSTWYDPDSSSDFYDQKYGVSTNGIYVNLREAVKLIIAEVVDVITNLADLDLSPYTIFSRPDDLDPEDSTSLLSEIRSKVNSAIDVIKTYFTGSEGRGRVKNLIAQLVDEQTKAIGELQSFITQNFDKFAVKEGNIDSAKRKLATELIDQAVVTEISQVNEGEHPNCAPDEPFSESDVKAEFEEEKKDDVENDIDAVVTLAYEEVKSQELSVTNNGENSKPLYIIGGLQNVIDETSNIVIELITSVVHGFGFIPMGCDMVRIVAWEIIYGGEMVNTKFLQYTKVGVPFELWEDEYEIAKGQGTIGHETLRVDQEPDYLSNGEDIQISISGAKGIHYTAINSFSTRPFETSWKVSIKGQVEQTTRTESRIFLKEGSHDYTRENRSIEIDLSITVTVYSGWNLEGIDYELSNTLLSDIIDFLTKIWEYIESVVGSVFDALTKLIESFLNLLFKLISYVSELIKLIVDTISYFITLLSDFIQFIMDSIISDILEVVATVIGDGFRISIFGFTFEISGNSDVAQDSSADGDLLLVSTSGGIAGVDMIFTVRFARYHEANDNDPHYDILLDGALGIGDFDLELAVDPLMAINSYIIEGHGIFQSDDGEGWGIDFYVPEIEEYKEVRWSLDDHMGGLNSIPIPFLGITATIDAGFVIQYIAPKGEDIVINEFESNPQGSDEGLEWFEIYNPADENIDDWTVSFAHGGYVEYKLSDLTSENKDSYTVYTLPTEILQNGQENDPFSPGDGLILKNEDGDVVDRTPKFKDPGSGDGKTWQRTYDGSVIWKLKDNTKSTQNGEDKIDIKSEIENALKTSFQLAWDEFADKELGLDAIIEFIQDWIHNFIDLVLTLISDVVHRVYIFLDLIFEDMSGSAGAGIGLSIGMDGVGLSELLGWLVDTIETFIYNICNPGNPEDYPSIPKGLPEHMFLRFQVFFEIGTPKIIEKVSSDDLDEIRISIAVQANIPAQVALLGWDWGDWEVVFGAYIAHAPSRAFSEVFGTSDDPDTYVDIWLLKARVYEIS